MGRRGRWRWHCGWRTYQLLRVDGGGPVLLHTTFAELDVMPSSVGDCGRVQTAAVLEIACRLGRQAGAHRCVACR